MHASVCDVMMIPDSSVVKSLTMSVTTTGLELDDSTGGSVKIELLEHSILLYVNERRMPSCQSKSVQTCNSSSVTNEKESEYSVYG